MSINEKFEMKIEEPLKPEKIYDPEKELLSEKATNIFMDAVNKKEGDYNIALCGGRSAKDFYNKISERASEIEDINKLHIWLVDERFNTKEGDYDISDRNTAVIEDNILNDLVEKFNFSRNNFHRLPEGDDIAVVTKKYEEEFKKRIPDGKLDLTVLGSGEDGHVAGIFPDKEAINSQKEEFSFETNSPKFPPLRITASPETIKKSEQVFLFMVGEGKKQALEGFENEDNVAYKVTKGTNLKVFTDIDTGK